MKRKIISGNRITIPKHLIDEWNLKSGDFIEATFKKHYNAKEGIVLP